MKRLIACLLALVCFASLVFGAGEGRVIDLGSGFYDRVDALFVSAGQVAPSSARPWTVAEARNELSKLDASRLGADQVSLYESLWAQVSQTEGEKLSAGLKVSPEAYFHTNEKYATDDMWAYGFNERNPFAKMFLEASLDGFYTYCELAYGWGRTTNRDTAATLESLADTWTGLGAVVDKAHGNVKVVTQSYVYSQKALFNFPAITAIEIDTPRQTYFTFASDHISVGYYKSRKQWGLSTIGNFIYDSHVSAYNTISMKVFGQSFAFDYSFMIPAQSYSNAQSAEVPATFRRVFASHRLDWYVLDNLTLTASENIMYRFDTPDIDILNPGSIYHNNTNSRLLNAIAHLEIQYAPFAGVLLYGQFCLDQATAPTESNDQDPAWGLSAGLSYAAVRDGLFRVSLEGLCTSAALYRRNYVDFIIHTNNSTNRPYTRYPIFTYMGFEYGGGVMALKVSAAYDTLDGFEAYASAAFYGRGQFGMLDSHNASGNNAGVPNRRLGILNGEVELSYILNMGASYSLELFTLPCEAFVDIAYLNGVRSWYGAQGSDLQVSLGVSVEARTR